MFDDRVIHFTYKIDNEVKESFFQDCFTCEDFSAEIHVEDLAGCRRFRLVIMPFRELETVGIHLDCPYPFDQKCRIFMNGYQSWSTAGEYFIDDVMKGIPRLAAPLKKTHHIAQYGDYFFYKYPRKKGRFHGYTYAYVRKGSIFNLIGSLTEKNGFTILEYDVPDSRVRISKDCEGLHIRSPYEALDIIQAEGSESAVFDSWFNAMGLEKPRCSPMNGWTSWYNYYQDINEPIILENLENIQKADSRPGIFQIDDGYQTAVGDWLSIDNDKFPNGLKYIGERIKAAGMKAGLWLAPFVCEKRSKVYREKSNWLLRDAKGKPVPAGSNWSGFYALDIYNNEVRQYLRQVFSTVFNEWGYDLVKLDFLYAACLLARRDKTRGMVMTEAMQFLRECAGDRLILGCGVPLGPSFGLVDYCRIGCDIGLDWENNAFMRLLIREHVSTRNAITNTISRRQLNGRFFLNDPDVFLLRDRHLKLNSQQKRTLFTANFLFGSLLFTSDNTGEYDEAQWELFNLTARQNGRTVSRVERYKKGLVEIFYEEDGEPRLALINLGGKKLPYIAGPALGREFHIEKSQTESISVMTMPRNGLIELDAYETRLFRLA